MLSDLRQGCQHFLNFLRKHYPKLDLLGGAAPQGDAGKSVGEVPSKSCSPLHSRHTPQDT